MEELRLRQSVHMFQQDFHNKPGYGASWVKHGDKYDPEKLFSPSFTCLSGQLIRWTAWVKKDKKTGPRVTVFSHPYGAATMYVMMDKIGDTVQGAVFRSPLKMNLATRAATSPVDGLTIRAYRMAGRSSEGSIQRLRHTEIKAFAVKEKTVLN